MWIQMQAPACPGHAGSGVQAAASSTVPMEIIQTVRIGEIRHWRHRIFVYFVDFDQ